MKINELVRCATIWLKHNLNSEWKRASYRKYMQHNCTYVVFQTGKTQVFFLGMHTQELKLKKNKELLIISVKVMITAKEREWWEEPHVGVLEYCYYSFF